MRLCDSCGKIIQNNVLNPDFIDLCKKCYELYIQDKLQLKKKYQRYKLQMEVNKP